MTRAPETAYDNLGRVHLVYRRENTAIQRVTHSGTNWANSFTPGEFYRKLTNIIGTTRYRTRALTNGSYVLVFQKGDVHVIGEVVESGQKYLFDPSTGRIIEFNEALARGGTFQGLYKVE